MQVLKFGSNNQKNVKKMEAFTLLINYDISCIIKILNNLLKGKK